MPPDIARSSVVTGMGAVTADATASAILEAVVGLNITRQDPSLEHGPGLTVRGSLTETGDDADDRGTVIGADALPKDAPVRID